MDDERGLQKDLVDYGAFADTVSLSPPVCNPSLIRWLSVGRSLQDPRRLSVPLSTLVWCLGLRGGAVTGFRCLYSIQCSTALSFLIGF